MPRRHGFRRAVWIGLAVVLAASACSGDDGDGDSAAPPPGGGDRDFEIVLSAGKRIASTERAVRVVEGAALDDDATEEILRRLPPFSGREDERPAFRRPPEPLPRPRVGRTIEQAFGGTGEGSPPPPVAGPLEVVRRQPEGDVEVAPSLSVTFNQPMVPLGTLDELDEEDVPVRVTPQLDGRWRWIGTRTLRFEHAAEAVDRLPMATEYRVEVPAGTRSRAGNTLDDAVTWTFRTPPPRVVSFLPEGKRIGTEQVFLAVFDQRVDATDVRDTVVVEAGGDRQDIRIASDEEVAADEGVRQRRKDAPAGRSMAFRATTPLPTDAKVAVTIGPGTPSAEGPRVTGAPATYELRTRGAFAVTGHECDGGGTCRPGSQVSIIFNNQLDLDAFDWDSVEVRPDAGAVVNVYGNTVVVQAAWRANTAYEVRVPPSVRDEFGQRLGKAETVQFEVGAARPVLNPFPQRLITADPHGGRPSVSVTSAGHETLQVDAYAVQPDDFPAYEQFLNEHGDRIAALPAWRRLSSSTVEVDGGADELTETSIDLDDMLGGRPGHLVVVVSPTRAFPTRSEDYWSNRPTLAWVQVTSLGLDAVADRDDVVAWVTDLRDGTPVSGATVRFGRQRVGARTGDDGLATLPATKAQVLVVSRGGDSAVLTPDYGGWEPQPVADSVRWFVFDDRQLYRPGEHVRVKGWVRLLTRRRDARLVSLGGDRTAGYVLRDTLGNELASGSAALNTAGGFDLDLAIPPGAGLGPASLELHLERPGDLNEADHFHQIQIQEFRRPEFEVETRAESRGPHLLTRPVTVRAGARYFAGGMLADAPVTWRVTQQPTTYAPPNRSDFTFGVWTPPWLGEGDHWYGGTSGPCCPPPEEVEELTYRGRTDAAGDHYLQLDFEGQRPDLPISVSANAAVEDVNRQQFGSTVDLLVHPAKLYVGLRSSRTFVRQGQPLEVDAIVTDLDGTAVAGREITMTAARVEQRLVKGEWKEVEKDTEDCTSTSAKKAVTCSFPTRTGGEYRIRAVVADADGGRNRSELIRWVSGGEAIPTRVIEQQQVTIVPDRTEHQVGDTAELLVISPFDTAHGRLTIGRNGIESTRTFELRDGSAVLELPITEGLVPGIDVQVDLVGATARAGGDGDLPRRAAFATGTITMTVPPRSKVLQVDAEPEDRELEPGGETSVAVTVTGADGRPLPGAEVAVVVVDESVLSLVGYELPDPVAELYRPLGNELRVDHGRRTLVLADPSTVGKGGDDDLGGASTTAEGMQLQDGSAQAGSVASDASPTAAAGGATGRSSLDSAAGDVVTTAIEERTNFDALAVFAPALRTGADGTVSVPVRLPDNLTRYRVMAVATDGGERFGSGESSLTARIPLMVRPSAPRFLNFGDRFELPVVVQNQTDVPVEVAVVVETANLELDGAPGRVALVPANGRVEVRFPAEAGAAGTGRYRVTAVSGAMADSASGSLPVYSPVTTEAFATYGVVDDGAVAQPLRTPSGVIPEFGGLEIDTSSTAVQALTDAVVYLVEYPYASADAYASRITALVSLREVFAAFAAEGVPSPEQLDQTIRADLDALVGLQTDDGGFATWERGQRPDPYASVQATHALVVAGAAGYPVSADARRRALDAVKGIEAAFTPDWDRSARSALSAYALHVRNLAGDRDSTKAEALYREDGELPLDALAWLWPVVADGAIDAEIERTLANRVTETPAGATFTTGYEEGAHLVLASDRRTDGIVLDALLTKRPTSDLIPKVVNGLVGNQVRGRWGNVQENTFILLALRRYFATFESQTPAFVARTWLDETFTAEHPFRGRSIERQRTLVPMSELGGDPEVVIGKEGPGRLYYRLGLRYAPEDLVQRPRDEGFVVDRTYEAVDDERDVRQDEDGTWHIAPGAMVRVRLTMVADSARTNMALVDSLPAGLETVNPALVASPRTPQDRRDRAENPLLGFSWFDHQHLRDDRAEAFGAYLGAGTYEYSYVARATTIGTFIAPPAKAEEIYAPEVFGRSATATVRVGR